MNDERPAQTFLFADLAGFTAVTEAHGDEHAADLVDSFCADVRGLLADYDAEEVKAIGDALMLRSSDASAGVRLALRIADELGGRHGFPAVRIGVHTGPAVARGGDWFGATVNLASRVSAAAHAGDVLITPATHAAAGDLGDVEVRSRGTQRFKNVAEPVEVFSVASRAALPAVRLVTDPVCRMAVDPAHATGPVRHAGAEYFFCSTACAETFQRHPARYRRRGSRSELRVSDDARERAVSLLRRAYKRGRISLDELEDRSAHAYAARTRGELGAVLRDLPAYRRARLARRPRLLWFGPLYPFWLLWRRLRRPARRRRELREGSASSGDTR